MRGLSFLGALDIVMLKRDMLGLRGVRGVLGTDNSLATKNGVSKVIVT